MADLVASDLTYTLLGEDMTEGSKVRRRFAITTAAGEYPTGGLPLDSNALGTAQTTPSSFQKWILHQQSMLTLHSPALTS